ncbi:MAG TPA: hypothetical protein VF519_03175 [Mycobacteriales bacterium]|jgi:hypothetical protein
MTLVEETGASARAAASLPEAIAVVLEAVAVAADWPAAHAWLAAAEPNTWVSSGLWFPDDAIGLGALKRSCVGAPPTPARGHLALALHMEATQWVADLSGMLGTSRYDAAMAAGMRSAVACPVYANGRAVAILEWYLTSSERPAPDVAHALGHLSGVLSEVAERPVVVAAPPSPPSPRAPLGEAVRWVTEEGVLARLLLA